MRAAREVFSELGYDAATFQAIAVRADLTRPAINHYFSSKRVLYREVVEQANEMVVRSGIARARSETTLLGRLSAFIEAAVQADCADR
jgi:AcrR family transcriptional regulator